MRRLIPNLAVFVVMAMLFLVPSAAFGATTASVVINATPSFVSITNAPDNYAFGVVATSSVTNTTQNYFTITNASTVTTSITVGCNTTWTEAAPTGWDHSETATIGADEAGLIADDDTDTWGIIVKNASPNDLKSALGATTNQDWGLSLLAPSSFTNGVIKTNTVTLTSTAD